MLVCSLYARTFLSASYVFIGFFVCSHEFLQIVVDVDWDPRAAYFRQAKNGLYIKVLKPGPFIEP